MSGRDRIKRDQAEGSDGAAPYDADAYRQVKDAWEDATEARQIIMLDDLRDLLDGIGCADDDEDELREKVERLILEIEDDLGIDESGQ